MAQRQRSRQKNGDRMDVDIVSDKENDSTIADNTAENTEEELERTFTPIQKLEVCADHLDYRDDW